MTKLLIIHVLKVYYIIYAIENISIYVEDCYKMLLLFSKC